MSGIQISVAWDDPVVHAGQDLKCTITFTNAAHAAASGSPQILSARKRTPLLKPQPLPSPSNGVPSPTPRNLRAPARGHRAAASIQLAQSSGLPEPQNPGAHKKHRRSVSVLSIAPQPRNRPISRGKGAGLNPPSGSSTPGHSRSPSLVIGPSQGLPFRSTSGHSRSPSLLVGSSQNSPLSPRADEGVSPRNQTARPPSVSRSVTAPTRDSIREFHNGQPRPLIASPHERNDGVDSNRTTVIEATSATSVTSRQNRSASGDPAFKTLLSQRLSEQVSPSGTPRSSIDYTPSHHSSETVTSEYPAAPAVPRSPRFLDQPPDPSLESNVESNLEPVTLMMGYVQLQGNFVLDSSLVNPAPFEKVKKRGVIGGQAGGGVVGVDHSRKESGFLGPFGWSSLGSSLGSILTGGNQSSFKDMKDIASTKAVPIISTPQSVLFVDLKLRPGESKSFSYSHALPPVIPPSFRGRTFKSMYNLLIGVQRRRSAKEQPRVMHVEAPFRVFPSMEDERIASTYDLMDPYVFLRDQAHVEVAAEKKSDLSDFDAQSQDRPADLPLFEASARRREACSTNGFEDFVRNCLTERRRASELSLQTPVDSQPFNFKGQGTSAGGAKVSKTGPTFFNIHQEGSKFARVEPLRGSYRLGESVPLAIDFQDADTTCYGLCASLETLEEVDPGLALRSAASIARVTRRVHAQIKQDTICAERTFLDFVIPRTATPQFSTTGVTLKWILRIDFVVSSLEPRLPRNDELLEPASYDERGRVWSALQELPCGTLNVTVPIQVHGFLRGDGSTQPPFNTMI